MEQQPTVRKKRIFSAIQPTGIMTLGNYLGAVRNWVEMQDEFDCIYSIANMHAITVRQDPKELRENTLRLMALLLACGIDPERSVLFVQSQVKTHAELSWVLNCCTQFGELSRMTQFKDKSARHPENINAGLFDYPVLMAADILLYQADLVPVGDDQRQHVELTRNIAQRFNTLYGQTFVLPEGYYPKLAARVMSLQDPTKKMSKSDDNPKAFISILDKPETILKKFRSAVTDSEAQICYREGKEGINNLMSIYSAITGRTLQQITDEFAGKGYGEFKTAVGEAVAEALRPVQERYEAYRQDKAYLEGCCRKGAEQALRLSQRTLEKVYRKVGFLSL
ncbi:MAG TPA: tryptophan--tRNA ligase [Candidatus Anaerotruncus excrementipullorum]|uniref:Tryptophan--tRNA ligase n=1 Tax=Candidatus Anaerotruncus excrementipullorum TaxID=2838465 RepID=A0A9D1WSP6_9FIRM|nr:tryptophan--tRNA ligase [Candidatus Anaerotruncus excrementipullorum]